MGYFEYAKVCAFRGTRRAAGHRPRIEEALAEDCGLGEEGRNGVGDEAKFMKTLRNT